MSIPALAPKLTELSAIPHHERMRLGDAFSDMSAPQMAHVLRQARMGYMELYADWCKHILRTDVNLAADYRTRLSRVAYADYVIEAAEVGGASQAMADRAAEDVTRMLEGVPNLRDRFVEMLDAIGVGYSAHEILWRPGELVMVDDLAWRHQRRFRFDDNYRIRLWDSGIHRGDQWGVELPQNKFIVHIGGDLAAYPSERGVFQQIAWLWLFKLWAEKAHIHFVEKHGSPLVYGKVPANTPEATRNQILSDLSTLVYDSVGLMDEGADVVVEAAAIAATKGEAYQEYLRRADELQTKILLGTTDATAPGENGARAAVDGRIAAASDPIMKTDGARLAGTLVSQLIRPFLYYNRHRYGGRLPPMPRFRWAWETESSQYTPEVIGEGALSLNELRESQGAERYEDPRMDIPMALMRSGDAPDASQATPANDDAAPEGLEVQRGEDVQRAALNGAQVTSLREIVSSVARGEIPRATGVEMITASFPIDHAKAEAIMGTIGEGFQPAPEPAGGQGAETPLAMSRKPKRISARRKTTSATATPTPPPLMRLIGTALSQASAGRARSSRGPSST